MRSDTLKIVFATLGSSQAATALDDMHNGHQQPDLARLLDQAQDDFIGDLWDGIDQLERDLESAQMEAKAWWEFRTSVAATNLAFTTTMDCIDTAGAADFAGDGCDYYAANPEYCGVWDKPNDVGGFVAANSCCACGKAEVETGCTSDPLATDTFGDSCGWYATQTSSCGLFDSPTFTAATDCCECRGAPAVNLAYVGVKPKIPAILAAQKPVTLTAAKKTAMLNLSRNPLNLSAKIELGMLLQQRVNTDNGARDSGGDDCTWYTEYSTSCGLFDDDDFIAAEMCAGCGGGVLQIEAHYDAAGDGCSWYEGRASSCGLYDDDDFEAKRDCKQCASETTSETCPTGWDADYTARDGGNDGCDWYIGKEYACGSFDVADVFTASELCCACFDRPSNYAINLSDFPGTSKAKLTSLLLQGVNLNSIKSNGFTVAQQSKAQILLTECVSGNATDQYGDGCSWYETNPGSCGSFDNAGFTAGTECCACGGGTCIDSERTDSFGDGCAWYDQHTANCGQFDHEFFTAATDCCSCKTAALQLHATVVMPTFQYVSSNDTDSFGDSCSWYGEYPESCGTFDGGNFTAAEDCLECGGRGVCVDVEYRWDSSGDGCAWYDQYPESCGMYDDDDFRAFTMCCACEGRQPWNLASTAPTKAKLPVLNLQGCADSANATDLAGDGCDWYDQFPDTCGDYDTEFFTAHTDCCACGGGDIPDPPTDQAGDGCDWYVNNTMWCDRYNDDDFIASSMCPACMATYAVLTGIKAPHPMVNLQRGAFPLSLAGFKKIPLNMVSEMAQSACQDSANGAVDSAGDGCEWYESRTDYCGMFADDDFDSNTHCCVCGGGETITVPAAAAAGSTTATTTDAEPVELACLEQDGEARDSGNDSCTWYAMYPGSCGSYDDDDFVAGDMCCSCGGGTTMVEEDGAIEDAFEAIVIDVTEPHTEEEIEEVVEEWREYNHSYRPIKDLVDALNDIGHAPEWYANMTRIGLIEELRRAVNEADHSLSEAKREILRAVAQPLLLSAESDAAQAEEQALIADIQARTAAAEAGTNLEEITQEEVWERLATGLANRGKATENLHEEGPLSTPEWSIDVDHDEGEAMIESLEDEYEQWQEEAEDIWEQWQRDREVVDRYYWRYVMQPHLNAGSKLDERAMREVVTFIASGTTVKGRPLTDVFPEVQDAMMTAYNPDEPSLLEKFGMFNLAESEEWPYADYWEYEHCVATNNFSTEAARGECQWYDTYNNDFTACTVDFQCEGYDAFMLRHPTGRVEEESVEDVVEEIAIIEQAIEEEMDPHGGAVVYSLHFDEEMVNAWVANQSVQFGSIGAMFESEVHRWMEAVEEASEEAAPRFEEIHEAFRAQADSSLFDVERWLSENASVDVATAAVSLSARIESRKQPAVSSSEKFMYASVAIASLVAVYINVQQMRTKKEAEVGDAYQKLI